MRKNKLSSILITSDRSPYMNEPLVSVNISRIQCADLADMHTSLYYEPKHMSKWR